MENKKPMPYQQHTFAFDQQPQAEPAHITETTSKPPPADQGGQAPLLVRPDRQLTYEGLPHYEWPDPEALHDRDTISVDRIREDIDGPSHRFLIKRFDRVEVFFSAHKTEIGQVVGISHKNQEVRVRFREGTDGLWFYKGQIYPAVQPKAKRPRNGQPLSQVVAEVNYKHGAGLTEADLVLTPADQGLSPHGKTSSSGPAALFTPTSPPPRAEQLTGWEQDSRSRFDRRFVEPALQELEHKPWQTAAAVGNRAYRRLAIRNPIRTAADVLREQVAGGTVQIAWDPSGLPHYAPAGLPVPEHLATKSEIAAAGEEFPNRDQLPAPTASQGNTTAQEQQTRAPTLAPYTFEDFKKFHGEFAQGTVSFADYQREFQWLWESQEPLQAELVSRFNAKQLAVLAARFGSWDAKRSTKDDNAQHIVQKMLSAFVLDGSVSYRPMSGETYQEAVQKKVFAVTEAQYYREFEKRQLATLETEKALQNPETFLEFRTFLRAKGIKALTDEQLARYDALHAEMTRERRAKEAPTTVAKFQSEDLQGLQFSVKEGFHDKRQCPLWIVQLESRVEREAYNELNRKAKMLGGWYSSFKKDNAGFQFLDKDQADRFCSLLSGDADRSAVLEARKERQELTAAERLHQLAKELFDRAEETIERSSDSLQNTQRRASIQAGVRGQAYADQALSRSLHSIAEALSRGEAQFLDGIRHKTHVETLDSVLDLAKWARIRAHRQQDSESSHQHHRRLDELEQEPLSEPVIRFAAYPYPWIYKRHLEDLVSSCRQKKGVKLVADKMHKRLSREKEEHLTFKAEHDIEALSDFLERAKTVGVDIERVAASLDKYKRLRRAGITDIHELRAALREYLEHRAEKRGDSPVQIAERELIGKKLPGFFPTPRPVIERMLELAAVQAQHSVLEPSCGKGDILDALQEECPGIKLSAIESNHSLAEVLAAKGHAAEFGDFLEHHNSYDRIVMNPPFEDGQDLTHIQHAYSLLLPGGRLVSVISEGPFFRSDKQSTSFREWLNEVGAETEPLPEDAFQGKDVFRETGVHTRLLTIDKE